MDLGVDLLPDVLKAPGLIPSTGLWDGVEGITQGKAIDLPNSSSHVLFMVKNRTVCFLLLPPPLMDTRQHIPSSVQGHSDWCLI